MKDFADAPAAAPDLDTCDLEPIHIPGAIQAFGALLACPLDFRRISHCSANIADIFGTPPERFLGTPPGDWLTAESLHDLRNLCSASTARSQRERLGAYSLAGAMTEIYAHVNAQDSIVVEFEPAPPPDEPGTAPIDQMRQILSAASARDSVQQLLEVSVAGLAQLTGFDRVMAYRYEANGDGQVVAEARTGDMPSFLGLRYPAWDVPTQARALQIRNPVRLLSDVGAAPVAVLAADKGADALDLSLAHLRGASPIHVEYLGNMGVRGSLTIGLVVDGALWGMFACHHGTPRLVRSQVRLSAELFGQMISLVIKQKLDLETSRRRHRAAGARERILADTDAKSDLLRDFDAIAPILADAIDCDGLALLLDGETRTYGSVPDETAIAALAAHAPGDPDLCLAIENLSAFAVTRDLPLDRSGGAYLVRSAAAAPLQILFFRDERTRTLTWAGKPEKEMGVGPLGPRITPRGSFEAYCEEQRGFCEPWSAADRVAAGEVQTLMTQIAAKGDRVQLARHKDLVGHQRQQELMIAELNHRVKNILALIRSLSRQAKASSASLESYAHALEQRIAAMAAAHDLAVSNTMRGVSLRGIFEAELRPFLDDGHQQVLMTGPKIGLRADVAPMIALVLHELVSNAVKYGALSTPEGVLQVKWTLEENGLSGEWRELGGPAVADPERHGFGRSLIEKAIPFELDGDARLDFQPAGVRFRFTLPAETLVELDAETPAKLIGSVGVIEKVATGRLALLVEDNVVLAMDMVESLSRLGTASVETASSFGEGLRLAQQGRFDFAVLDLNLRGTVSFEIAETLKARGVPVVFVTGYGASIALPEHLGSSPVLTKPVDEGTLTNALRGVLA